jgi:DNA-binding transcriptional LysR family regulator
VPTREARLLHEELGRVYEGVERVRGVVARFREHGGGEVRVLCAPSVAHSLAMERLAGVPRDARDLRLVLDTAPFAPMMEALAARRADVGVAMAAAPVPDLASRVVATLEFALAVPRTHRLAAASAARAADLRGERLVTYRPGSPLFGILRGTPFGEVLDRGAVEVGSSLLACAAVANGLGVAIAERGLILGPPVPRPLGLRRDHAAGPGAGPRLLPRGGPAVRRDPPRAGSLGRRGPGAGRSAGAGGKPRGEPLKRALSMPLRSRSRRGWPPPEAGVAR